MRFVSPLLHQLFQIIAVKGLKVLYKKIEILAAKKGSLTSHILHSILKMQILALPFGRRILTV